MIKTYALFCIKDPKVAEIVSKLGDVISSRELNKLLNLSCNDELSPWYCPVTACDEGSPLYNKLEANGWKYDDGHVYDIKKEVIFMGKRKT